MKLKIKVKKKVKIKKAEDRCDRCGAMLEYCICRSSFGNFPFKRRTYTEKKIIDND